MPFPLEPRSWRRGRRARQIRQCGVARAAQSIGRQDDLRGSAPNSPVESLKSISRSPASRCDSRRVAVIPVINSAPASTAACKSAPSNTSRDTETPPGSSTSRLRPPQNALNRRVESRHSRGSRSPSPATSSHETARSFKHAPQTFALNCLSLDEQHANSTAGQLSGRHRARRSAANHHSVPDRLRRRVNVERQWRDHCFSQPRKSSCGPGSRRQITVRAVALANCGRFGDHAAMAQIPAAI